MDRRLLVAAALLLLTGCAALEELRGIAPGVRGAEDQLVFLDRLRTASPEELKAIGAQLAEDIDEVEPPAPIDTLRYALWQSTRGHDGYAPQEAQRRLNGLLEEGRPPRDIQALIRVQLRHINHMQTKAALQQRNRQLSAGNGELQKEIQALEEQIQALTTLERRMGAGAGDGSQAQ